MDRRIVGIRNRVDWVENHVGVGYVVWGEIVVFV